MKFEKIIDDVRKGKPFTDGFTKYRYNTRKKCIERWETDLRYIEGHKEPFWSAYYAEILFENILLSNWEICEK